MKMTLERKNIIEILQRNLKLAKVQDAAVVKKHKAAEEVHMSRFRTKLREALTWDYQTAKGNNFESERVYNPPACPLLEAADIDRWLRIMKLDQREVIAFENDKEIGLAITWIPMAERLASKACDGD